MQSRRHEDFACQSSYGRIRRNTDLDPDSYLMMSPHSKGSWSPRRMEGPPYSGRVLGGHRSASLERRRLVDDGGRRIRSRSPPYMEAKRGRPFYSDDWVMDRDLPTPERRSRYEFFNHMDMKYDDVESPTRNEFGYGRDSSRTAIIDNKFEGRRLDSGIREMGSQKSAVMGMYRSTGDVGPTSTTESVRDLPSASLNIGLGQPGKERVRYPDAQGSYLFDKYTAMKQYGDGEKNMVHPRDAPYSNLTASRSKESIGASHFKDYARTSPRKSRVDHLGYRGGIPVHRDNHNHPLNPADIPDPLSHSRYEQRQRLDLGRDPDLNINEDMARYRRETFSSPRTGHLDSLCLQPRMRERVDYLYPSDDVYEKMNLSERVDYNDRDMLQSNLLNHATQRAETSDFACRNMSSRSSLDHLSLEKLTATNNIGFSRSPAEKRESVQYLDTASVHSRLGRKISGEQEMPYTGMVQDREIEHIRVDHGYKRDVGTGSQKERMRSSPGVLYDTERLRLLERTHKREGHDLPPYDSSSRFLKRKYSMDDEENRITSRTITSRLNTVTRRQDREFSDEEWIDQDARGSYLAKRRDQTHGFSRRVDKAYDEADEEWFSSHPEERMHDHRMKSYKYDDKYAKGYSRSGSRGEHEQYESLASGVKSEPHEGSEEFKQLVHDFFLSFTKKLNDTPGVRRRYMEQGRAGSLFCVVCGRSLSKEFLDTRRLAMHAFMSHKVGLRAQHLGLHKAICVMLGWDGAIPPETIRWYPESLSSTEILVQKEDLIIWPPVIIIHNTSISNNNSNGQGPTTIEALGQFLRGKGLSSGKVRLGKPANCSMMLVKFLGTFSGLQEAERIHQYFAMNKHGRKEVEQMSYSKGKSKGENGNGDKDGEGVVFGYMGIAEDLDKVDFDTKRKCSIKSKKEIHDIADAPVKAE
ncbi:uncharacterized protein LOC112525768 isoform X2 [Cynara cardunculus var. scolymus]|uniref:uncharacterized protein LOC112525768 isoform X2 n=1 Tax=Cynara cardunculus var. scolymus TaxID=59895 RepID=UPI000D630FB1|nr:uncharacterized protein LOC112525768 isoform X2 [Cynara cardunculus var. scolymus]